MSKKNPKRIWSHFCSRGRSKIILFPTLKISRGLYLRALALIFWILLGWVLTTGLTWRSDSWSFLRKWMLTLSSERTSKFRISFSSLTISCKTRRFLSKVGTQKMGVALAAGARNIKKMLLKSAGSYGASRLKTKRLKEQAKRIPKMTSTKF